MKNIFITLVICITHSTFAQDLANKVPKNTPFAICINSKNLTTKVPVEKIQDYPWMQKLLEKEFKFLPKDLSQTGIDFNNNHYQYYTNKDSVMSYAILIPLTDEVLFEKTVQSKYGDSLKVTRKGTYTRVSTSKNHHLAWNKKFALLINTSYTKPHNAYDNDPYANLNSIDTTGVLEVTDTVIYDAAATPAYEIEEEVKPVEVKKTASKKNKKGKKTKKEPIIVEPTEEEIYAAQEKANAELEETNKKLLEIENRQIDSIERLKINPVVELIFKESFETENKTIDLKTTVFKNNNPKSDFYLFADIDEISNQIYSSFLDKNTSLSGIFKNSIFNSTLYANGYFEKDKIRLSHAIAPKNEQTKILYKNIFDSKIDKNLLNYIGNNVLSYYSISLDTEAIMEYEYQIMKNTLNTLYQHYFQDANNNEADILIDAIAIVIDEKAIAELIPGNALFVLHDIKKVERDYVTYEYDDNYEQKEIVSKKEELAPDFTFLLSTKNESFFNKLLQLPLNKSKFTATDYQLTNGYYTLTLGKDSLLENFYIGQKNGIVMLTTSKANIESLFQQIPMELQSNFKKSIAKNNSTFWIDLPKITEKSKTELEKENQNNYVYAIKNTGEIAIECKYKNDEIVSELTYTIKGDHANSLQYLFDMIDEMDKQSKTEETITE